MSLLAPLGLAALLVPLAIYAIHWLFGSRRRVRLPAIFLWADLPQARTGRSRRRRPPFTLLLLLQLLAATAAALALSRPATATDPPRHVALVLDASASMQAIDVAPSRFEAARASALARLDGLRQEQDIATVIRAGTAATLLASGPPSAVRGALATAAPGQAGAAIREGLALASSQIAATPERRGEIVLLTDGAFAAPESIGALATPVEVVATGGGSDNQAITSLVIRMDPSGRSQTAFVELANEADRAVRVPLRLTADGAPLDERQVDIAARTRSRFSVPLPADARNINVRLLGHDALALDDVADAVAPGGPPRDVLVLGRKSDGLRRALESVPSLRLRGDDATSAPPPDLTVLQANLPPRLPPGPLLLLDPPASSARLLGVGLGSGARVQPGHPLLAGLDVAALQAESPVVSVVPGWSRVVLGTLQGPLIVEGHLEGHPTVALLFDPAVSGLEKSLAYPLLINNAAAFLIGQTDPAAQARANTEPFDPAESDIAPRPLPIFASQPQTDLTTSSAGMAERWPWLAAAVVTLLTAEWLVFGRRG